MSFSGKTAIVTGTAGGMGRAIAAELLAEGANVAGIDAQKTKPLEGEGEFLPLKGSVADWLFVSRAVTEAQTKFGDVPHQSLTIDPPSRCQIACL